MGDCYPNRCLTRLLIAGLVCLMGSPFNIAFGQQRYVILNGTVTNEAGDALPQATVYIQGGSFSATTGDDGRFRLRVPAGACRIVCSMVGYEQQVYELTLDRDHRLDLVLISSIWKTTIR